MKTTVLESQNKTWGFYGTTLCQYAEAETVERWKQAFEVLQRVSGLESEEIRDYLDSRSGRKLADCCCGNDVKTSILKEYFSWADDDLFESKVNPENIKDTTMFGTMVINTITNTKDVLLYTFKKSDRVYKNYAMCINRDGKKYQIGMDYITPIEE